MSVEIPIRSLLENEPAITHLELTLTPTDLHFFTSQIIWHMLEQTPVRGFPLSVASVNVTQLNIIDSELLVWTNTLLNLPRSGQIRIATHAQIVNSPLDSPQGIKITRIQATLASKPTLIQRGILTGVDLNQITQTAATHFPRSLTHVTNAALTYHHRQLQQLHAHITPEDTLHLQLSLAPPTNQAY